ncbi:cupin domain-containing protein [Hydrogenophaga palleronii]|uniref:cupin domain-containing protein n=1 Tax=Hydrogenophaga palleronii TaxID=65655 RepID=UPI0008245EC9|nr:cupin domain-containing protein [Hydrogenophaga palleronii]
MRTRETFFCVDGRFEVRYGGPGKHRTELVPMDMIAVPTGVSRAFKNVSQAPAHLLVIIQGDPNDMADIAYAPEVGEEVVRQFGPGAKSGFEKTGITFDAGVASG